MADFWLPTLPLLPQELAPPNLCTNKASFKTLGFIPGKARLAFSLTGVLAARCWLVQLPAAAGATCCCLPWRNPCQHATCLHAPT